MATNRKTTPVPEPKPRKRLIGFAAMDRDAHREISRLGGEAAQREGVAHRFNHEEAVAAGKRRQALARDSGGRAEGAKRPPQER
jgi:general stress protein YciG